MIMWLSSDIGKGFDLSPFLVPKSILYSKELTTHSEWVTISDKCGIYKEEPAVPQARPGFPGWKDFKEVDLGQPGPQ